jgi:hypothetical protein
MSDSEIIFYLKPDPKWQPERLFHEGNEVVLHNGGKLKKRDPKKELETLIDRIHSQAAKITETALVHAHSDAEELAQLSTKQQRIALSARLPSSDVPFALKAAFELTKSRGDRQAAVKGGGVNINIAAAILPPQKPKESEKDVVIIDAKEIKEIEDE